MSIKDRLVHVLTQLADRRGDFSAHPGELADDLSAEQVRGVFRRVPLLNVLHLPNGRVARYGDAQVHVQAADATDATQAARREGRCPDGGTCHSATPCPAGACWRVANCGPLSGVFPGDQWPGEQPRTVTLVLSTLAHARLREAVRAMARQPCNPDNCGTVCLCDSCCAREVLSAVEDAS